MSDIDKIFSDTLALKSTEKLQLVDKILASMYPTNHGAEAIWKEEGVKRVEAYENGQLSAIDENEIFMKYKK